ncbi:MAG: DUF2181 domain-containing protein [Alphaproteobacteria bacterium]
MREMCRFFNVEHSHQLGWAHHVNTPEGVASCVADSATMVVAGDVVMHPQTGMAMMASPMSLNGIVQPSRYPFAQWLKTLNTHLKGAKIDVYSADALHAVLATITEEQPEIPLILHADVFNLLGDNSAGFEPEMFIHLAQRHWPAATLSLGWSLKREQDPDGKLEAMIIDQMTDLLHTKLGGLAYTIELRAGYTTNWERGAAFLLEPLEGIARPVFAENVVDGIATFRPHLFVANE